MDDTGGELHRRSKIGQKSNTVGRRADTRASKRWWVRRTQGQQRRNRQAPQWPATVTADEGEESDDGDGGRMRGGGGERRSANRRRRSGGPFKVDGLSQIQFTDFGKHRQPTARSTSSPSAMNFEATKGSHGFTFRQMSSKKRRLRFESKAE